MQEQLLRYLAPMLGEDTAANLLRHYCARMHVPLEEVGPAHLPELAAAMKPMLAVWLGSAGASHVADEIAHMGGGASSR